MNDRNAKRNAETMSVLAGLKYDGGKLPWELLPEDALEQVVRVLQFGAQKYAPRNWEKGIAYTRVYGAIRRHLVAWLKGEELDPETRISHLAHAACEILFALTFETRGMTECDDRPVTVNARQRANADRTVLHENTVLPDEIDADPGDPYTPAVNAILGVLGDATDHEGSRWHVLGALGGVLRRMQWPQAPAERLAREWLASVPGADVENGVRRIIGAWSRPAGEVTGTAAEYVWSTSRDFAVQSVSLNTLQALLAMGAPEKTIKELEDAIENGCGDPACTACKDKPNNRGVIPRGVTRH